MQVAGFKDDLWLAPPGTTFEDNDYVANCYSAHPDFNITDEIVAAMGLEGETELDDGHDSSDDTDNPYGLDSDEEEKPEPEVALRIYSLVSPSGNLRYDIILYFLISYYIILVLYYIILYYTILNFIIIYYTV